MTNRDRLKRMREHPSDRSKSIRQSYGKRLTGISETQRNKESNSPNPEHGKENAMTAFTMQVEYIDAETGELATDTIVIHDMEVLPAEPFLPEPDNNDEYPW